MDPSAFEAEDIERELRDASIEPETTVGGTASEFQRNRNVGRDDPLLLPGKSSTAAPPSSGSHFELHSSGVPEGNTAGEEAMSTGEGMCRCSFFAGGSSHFDYCYRPPKRVYHMEFAMLDL